MENENKVNPSFERSFIGFDDAAERAKEEQVRAEQIEKDKLLPPDPEAILEVRHLKKHFVLKKSLLGKPLSTLKAVDDVSFVIKEGETLGIVGESGCGKTTMGRTILKLHQPTDGQIFFEGVDISKYTPKQMRALRTKMQIVFQDPYSSLPPRSTVGGILSEAVKVHKIVPDDQVKDYVLKIMDQCGLRDYYYERYPHEFSGGQRQRICIARALAVAPKLVVCDEPVSALDVSIQAQIINLLRDLQKEMGLTYIFISHDLSVVEHISDYIGVMYLGSMVEYGSTQDIFENPMHPYTEALFSAVPVPDPNMKMNRIILSGDIPSPINAPSGCKFHTRCGKCMEICKTVEPKFKDYGNGHKVACHLYSQED
jgi:peptide/nickel transport system ATP-binding protein